jgi:squalene-hopene/tetraprenyl-beta-curcumene cyclase
MGLTKMDRCAYPILDAMIPPAAAYLLGRQRPDGSWNGIEHTALAVTALASAQNAKTDAVEAGLNWLVQHTRQGTCLPPAAIGLYFAKLWYTEDLYPVLFTLAALQAAAS